MKAGTKVKHKETGRLGVVVEDHFNCCDLRIEVPVVWDGQDWYQGSDPQTFEDLGPEDPQPSLERCGAGSEEACIFLCASGQGLECQRFGPLREPILTKHRTKKMTAARNPMGIFPGCQLD